jgi:hypothetical protein
MSLFNLIPMELDTKKLRGIIESNVSTCLKSEMLDLLDELDTLGTQIQLKLQLDFELLRDEALLQILYATREEKESKQIRYINMARTHVQSIKSYLLAGKSYPKPKKSFND